MQSRQEFCVDPKLLEKITEYTVGGFFLLLFDDNGNPRFVKVVENQAYDLAIDKAVELYSKQREMTAEQSIIEQIYDDDEEED